MTREVEWDETQQAYMLALHWYRGLVHSPCGGFLPDTTDPEAFEDWDTHEALRCHRCTALIQATAPYQDSPQPQALMMRVTRRKRGRHD